MYKRYRHGEVQVEQLVEEVKAALGMPAAVATRGPFPRLARVEDLAPGTIDFPFPADDKLRVILVRELPHGFLTVTDSDLPADTQPDDLLEAAVANLKAVTADVAVEGRGEGHHLSMGYSSGDGYDASRILLRSSLEAMAEWLEGDAYVAIPSANMLMLLGDSDPEFVREAEEYVQSVYESDASPLSPRLYRLSEL